MKFPRQFLCAFLASVGLAIRAFAAVADAPAPSSAGASFPSPERVVVVANSRDPDSPRVARYYMQQRKIPDKNLILIDMPGTPDITWTEFVEKIFNPLRYRLTKDGWFDAYVTDSRDADGRLRYVFYGNKIDFLVVCYGVPIRIIDDPARLAASPTTPLPDQFKTNHGSVDGELALLATLDTPTIGLVPNPLYRRLNSPPSLVVRVARLDGPNPGAVKDLIDSALAGEALGVQGRAYIDMGGPHPQGEEWLKQTSADLRTLGFDISEDTNKDLFGWPQRFDAPVFYFGWYAYELAGPIADPQFRFPPGAIAVHIHSYSGAMVRDGAHRWVGPLVARGVAATLGNVYEPYLEFTHHLDLFVAALVAGRTTGEAAYYSLPGLSWQEIFVGDPLYRPFAVGLPQQLERADKDPTPFSPYAVIRQMNLLREQGRLQEALEFGQAYYDKHPSLPVAFALAQISATLGHEQAALQRLIAAPTPAPIAHSDLGLLSEIARWANDNHGPQIALTYYAKALAAPGVVPDFVKAVAPEAILLAKNNGADVLARQWQAQLAALKPPTDPAAKP